MFIFYFNTNFFVLCGIVQIAIDVYKYTKHGKYISLTLFVILITLLCGHQGDRI
jgi:hypothetical protein